MTECLLPPSKAARRMACPGSRIMEQDYPSEETQSVREGIAAHWVAAQTLKQNSKFSPGDVAENGELITQEMLDAINVYVQEVLSHASLNGDGIERLIDFKIEYPTGPINSINSACRGVIDAFCINDGVLKIWDFKYGHSYVSPFENWQLLEYAASIIGDPLYRNKIKNIELTVVQPRCYGFPPIKNWRIDLDVFEVYLSRLKESENISLRPDAPCIPNPLCKTCNARVVCPTLQIATSETLEIAELSYAYKLNLQNYVQELQLLKRTQKLLEARITGIEQILTYSLKQGERVPGYCLKPSNKRERWIKPVDEVIQLGQLFNIDLAKPIELITPLQAVKKGIPEDVIKTYSEKPQGELVLTEDNEKTAREIFGG